eukprot:4704983-Prorocentrum_lima.AAC.1
MVIVNDGAQPLPGSDWAPHGGSGSNLRPWADFRDTSSARFVDARGCLWRTSLGVGALPPRHRPRHRLTGRLT